MTNVWLSNVCTYGANSSRTSEYRTCRGGGRKKGAGRCIAARWAKGDCSVSLYPTQSTYVWALPKTLLQTAIMLYYVLVDKGRCVLDDFKIAMNQYKRRPPRHIMIGFTALVNFFNIIVLNRHLASSGFSCSWLVRSSDQKVRI